MECALIQERLSEYIDGTLDANDRAAVENHISTCKNCKEDLASLTEMVEKLHAMDPVEAPADFLEKIHERMDSRFSFNRIIRKLFIPFRIKIPLELAAAATISILVFFVFNIQQKEGPSVQILSNSISEKLAEKPTEDRTKPAFEKEAKGVTPVLEVAPATPPDKEQIQLARKSKAITIVQPSIPMESKSPASVLGKAEKAPPVLKDETIELTLALKTALTGDVYEPGITMEPAQAPKKDEKAARTGSLDSNFFERNVTTRHNATDADLLTTLENIIRRAQGKVSTVEIDPQTDRLKSIEAEIPAQSYPSFCRELARLATFQAPPRPLSGKELDTIQVRINFIYPN